MNMHGKKCKSLLIIYIYIYISFFHHTTCESTCDTLTSSAANQGDNTVSVAQGGRNCVITLVGGKKCKSLLIIYIYIYIYILAAFLR